MKKHKYIVITETEAPKRKHRIAIIGGGTIQPIASHLSLCAPAFGTVAVDLYEKLQKMSDITCDLYLTKMADCRSKIKTNDDVKDLLLEIIEDKGISAIIMSAAMCDFKYESGSFHGDRFDSSDPISLNFTPAEKVLDIIRRKRPDIFLVGFKTTTNKSVDGQLLRGLKMMKRSKCNLVLANDTITRNNIVITPEETYYANTTDRAAALDELVEILTMRLGATYHYTNFKQQESYPASDLNENFQTVLKYVINNDGFIENNGNGFTPGHFCVLPSIDAGPNEFYSSQRKANHNKVFEEGVSLVIANEDDDKFTVRGQRKASVGARSQWMLLKDNPGYDCIIHTHNPLKKGSEMTSIPQKPRQCGSDECGIATSNNIEPYGDNIKAIYLEKHGANILFKSSADPQEVIDFINQNIDLGIKTT